MPFLPFRRSRAVPALNTYTQKALFKPKSTSLLATFYTLSWSDDTQICPRGY